MKGRLLVAAVGIPLLLVILLVLPRLVTAVVLAALCAIAARELLKTTGLLHRERMILETMAMAFCVPVWCHFGCPLHIGLPVILLFGLLEFTEALLAYPEVKFEGVLSALFAGFVIPLCLGSIVLLLIQDRGRHLVLIPIMIPFVADAGAYFAGYFFGKHKMAPVLSPKKTIEGAVGGVITGALSMVIYGLVMQFGFHLAFDYLSGALLGLVGSLVSIVGDLSFSMVKRETGIKDYGTIFRAHGGVLDRFDSVVFAAPVAALWMSLWPVLNQL